MNWLEKTVKILKTVGIGIISWWLVIFMMVISIPAGILLIIDVVYHIWTGRRIEMIKKILQGYAVLFTNPFDVIDD